MAERIRFSRSLYHPEAVSAAVSAYGALARITVDASSPHAVVVEVADPHPDLAGALVDAFCNHVLFETIRHHRAVVGGAL